MAKYQAYAEYKDSGVEWLGEVPSDWELNKFGYLFDFKKGLTITKENLVENGIPCINYGEIHSKYGFELDPKQHNLKCVPEAYLNKSLSSLLQKGDFIFADTSEDLKGSGNFTHLVNTEAVFAGYHTIIAKPLDPKTSRFFAYLFESKEFRSQIQLAVKGVKVFSITQAILRACVIWLPSFDEKKQIANFLDYETAKIDTLIAKQKKLIELLKEKRQAVISHAVTKGLDPNVKMKASGVEWLGDVPEHWNYSKLKYLLFKPLVYGANESAEDDNPVNPRYIRITDMNDDGSLNSHTFRSLPMKVAKNYLLKDKDILLARSGATVGKNFIYKAEFGKCCFAGYLIRARTHRNKLLAEYAFYFFQSKSYWQYISSSQIQATIQNVSAEKYNDFYISAPTKVEAQTEIVKFLDKQTQKIDNLISKAETAIKLMQERRTALISSAVTGKIDVRDWQKPQEA